jgi:glycine oxidase
MHHDPAGQPQVLVVGAGVAGLVTATVLAERGARVTLLHRPEAETRASHFAGGMLAPWCEAAEAPEVATAGAGAIAWWSQHFAGTRREGSLVLASRRDAGELARFARRTSRHRALDAAAIAALEPDLAGRFEQGLFFPEEAHLDPRMALEALTQALGRRGVALRQGLADEAAMAGFDRVVDCRGHAAAPDWSALRGVRGEMLLLRCPDVSLARPVRLLHPRIPLYIVPRGDGRFMVGATMVESSDRRAITVRSAMEMLNAAYALHPAFAEAEILEAGAGIRPALPDNMPAVLQDGPVLRLNGMYRHGFLLSPALAAQVADMVLGPHTKAGEDAA